MRNRFDRELDTLNNELIEMGSMIEKAIEMSIGSFSNLDAKRAEEVIEFDREINKQERTIENLCLKLLLQQQPVARDLRAISAALKMITDMERIGDHAADIAEITIMLSKTGDPLMVEHLQNMASETTLMVVKSVDAYVQKSETLAEEVISADDVVDNLFIQVTDEIVQLINTNPNIGAKAADTLMIAKYFERIGDHAVNIAEWVIYSISGEHVND